MTARQKEIYQFILKFYGEKGYPPTLNEICAGCYTMARGYIRETLWKFEEWGLIKLEDGKRRAMQIK